MKILKSLMIAAAAMTALTACDNIDEADRFVAVPRTPAKQTYLIQEFTGQNCVNCPTGASVLHNIQHNYGEESVIIVCLHPTGNPNCVRLDANILTSDLALTYLNFWGNSSTPFPCAILNGTGANSNSPTWSSDFKSIVDANAEKDPCAGIDLNAVYDPDTRVVNVDYDVYFTDTYGASASLILWITESGIKGNQKNNNPDVGTVGVIRDYTFNHVLRCSMNGDWGTGMQTTVAGTSNTGSASVRLQDNWNAENCTIVAYLIDSSSKVGLNAAQLAVPAKFEENTDSNPE